VAMFIQLGLAFMAGVFALFVAETRGRNPGALDGVERA